MKRRCFGKGQKNSHEKMRLEKIFMKRRVSKNSHRKKSFKKILIKRTGSKRFS